jgi:hypothetical protein
MKASLGAAIAVALALVPAAGAQAARKPASSLPEPKLRFAGTEAYEANGFDFIRYKYEVTNRGKFSKELFAASPDLPACGENPNAARTWVDIYDRGGKKLYWFCALTGPDDLKNVWFALTDGTAPPEAVYVEMTDRRTGATKRSNMVSTPK